MATALTDEDVSLSLSLLLSVLSSHFQQLCILSNFHDDCLLVPSKIRTI